VWESGNMSSRTYKRSVISQILKVCNPWKPYVHVFEYIIHPFLFVQSPLFG
jgi:hypothetical protein